MRFSEINAIGMEPVVQHDAGRSLYAAYASQILTRLTKHVRASVLLLLCGGALVACEGDSRPFLEAAEIQSSDIRNLLAIPPEGSLPQIFLNPQQQLQLGLNGLTSAGDTLSLDATGRDWFSTNTQVAVVDDNGLVTAVANGDVQIFAVVGGLSSTAVALTVQLATLESIDRIEGDLVIERCQAEDYRAIGNYLSPGGSNSERVLTNTQWQVDTANVSADETSNSASVTFTDGTATVIGSEPGELLLTASVGEITLQEPALLTVADSLSQIVVTPDPGRLNAGATLQFSAIGSYLEIDDTGMPVPQDSQVVRSQDITATGDWQITANPQNASVDNESAKGLVTGIRAGTARITARCGSTASTEVIITVNASNDVSDLTFNFSNPLQLNTGMSEREIKVSTGSTYNESNDVSDEVDWSFTNADNALRITEESDAIRIEPLRVGTATVTASYRDVQETLRITVSAGN